ncbi:hypothetical protein Sdagh_26990 [Streptomyces daghestanicus]|uniref:Uncharacterized protein n=1 Tax=Streptomyces daghestanicus TaxID=66885 RepID=A0ABQ3Q148_9ACTN|nr:hypothetical protein Sdagh_26990 [Streptomyces daghestanicus]
MLPGALPVHSVSVARDGVMSVSPYHHSGHTQKLPTGQLPGLHAEAEGADAMTPRKAAGTAARARAFKRMRGFRFVGGRLTLGRGC